MLKRIFALLILLVGIILGYGIFRGHTTGDGFFARHPFRLGLDLSGGSHLLYEADISAVPAGQINESMDALRDVIERRVNAFGVAEPLVATQTSTLSGTTTYRLSVDLPGVTDTKKAIEMIGATPFLEFRTQSDGPVKATVDENGVVSADLGDGQFVPTELTGKYLSRATMLFDPATSEPIVQLQFNDEGATLFEEITAANVGKVVAIYLDGQVISAPVVREAIKGGTAVVTGGFTPVEARTLVGRLNSGALPVPISLVSTQTVGATLGADAVNDGVAAAFVGFICVALFLLVWYRLPGLVAVLALALYVVITLLLYKFIPVTLTAAGIAGFIISIGMAVDANILIFERMREERARGRTTKESIEVGFGRAWMSIRDANIASLMISVILFWFGTSLIKGFALTLGLGVLVSMISAIGITRLFLRALPVVRGFLFTSGFSNK
jgi:preprotein translocase subunit SecD